MSQFSKNLKFLREKKKLSQNKLAELANVNQTTIARWENEEISPSLDNILDVADALNISVANLTGVDLEKKENNSFDEFELLFDKNKDVLTEDDKEYIKFIIEKRKKEIDKQLGKEE
nr:MAG TPA: helix-turn-helix domain protein [Caudoviricetes sp.]